MKFDYDGLTYAVGFSRQWFDITQGEEIVNTTPYTTVTIKIVDPGTPPASWATYRTATVGKWKHDQDIRALGRVHALRAVSTTLSKGMRRALWQTYMHRT